MAKLAITQQQATVASVVANLSTTASHTVLTPTGVSSASAYIPPLRRPNINSLPTHGQNVNVGKPQLDGTLRTSASVASTATIGNLLPPPNVYLASNAQAEGHLNQVAAQQNLVHRYSTK